MVVINPSRGDERTRDDIAALALPVIIGTGPDLDKLVAGSAATSVVRLEEIPADPGAGLRSLLEKASREAVSRGRVVAGGGAHAHQRHHRTTQAHRTELRHVGAQRAR